MLIRPLNTLTLLGLGLIMTEPGQSNIEEFFFSIVSLSPEEEDA